MSTILPNLVIQKKPPPLHIPTQPSPREQILPVFGQIPTPKSPSFFKINETPSINSLSNLNKNQQSPLPEIRSQSRLKVLPDSNREPTNQVFSATSNLISSNRIRQEARSKLPVFNAFVNNSKQRINSESPHPSSSSLIIADVKTPSSQTPKMKFIQSGNGVSNNIFHTPRNQSEFDNEPVSAELKRFNSAIKPIYQQTALHLIDTRIEQTKVKPSIILGGNSPREVIPQRASRFFNFDQNSLTNLPLSSYSVLGNKELSSPVSKEKDVSLENENKFIRRRVLHRATFNANVPSYKIDSPSNKLINSQSQPQRATTQEEVFNSLQTKQKTLLLERVERQEKPQIKALEIPSLDTSEKGNRLDINSLKNVEIIEDIKTPTNIQTSPIHKNKEKLSIGIINSQGLFEEQSNSPIDRQEPQNIQSEEKMSWVKLNPKLKNLRDENKSILRSRRSSENSRDSLKIERKDSSRRVTFIITNQPHNFTLKSMLWTIAFGQLLMSSITKWIRAKKAWRSSEFFSKFKKNKEFMIEFAAVYLKEPLGRMVKEKKTLYIIDPKASLNDLNNRCLKIHDHIISTLEAFLLGINSDKFPMSFFQSLEPLIGTSAVIPNHYLSEFELRRLSFTHYGTLKEIDEPRAKMILGCYVILRILLVEIIMRPWQVLSKVSQDKVNLRNLVNIGSILYHALMDILRTNLQPNKENQVFIHPEDRLIGMKEPLNATDKQIEDGLSDDVLRAQNHSEIEMIKGFYPKSLLTDMIKERTVLYQDIKDCLEDVFECLHKKVQMIYLTNPTEYHQSYLSKTKLSK